MRSETSFFNRTIFIKNIRRFWPIWTLYTIAFTIGMPVALASRPFRANPGFSVSQYVLRNALYMGSVMSFIFGVVSALAVFSYLFTSRSVGAHHTLPVRREGLFITNFLSGFVWLIVSDIFVFAATAITLTLTGLSGLGSLPLWLLMLALENLFFFGFASFCVMLTGNGFALVVIYGVLNIAAIIIESLLRFCISVFTYGITSGNSFVFGSLSPVYKLMAGTRIVSAGSAPLVYYYNGWSILAIYGAAGLLFACAAVIIYRRRHSESASEFIAVPALRSFFKYFFASFGSLVLGSLFYSVIFGGASGYSDGSAVPMTLCMALGGFFGYYITAMLLKKSFRVFRATSLGFLVYTMSLVVLMLAFEFDVFGMEKYLPSPDSVASLTYYAGGASGSFDDRTAIGNMIEAHKSLISNKSVYESYIRRHGTDISYDKSISVTYTYMLKSGRSVSRRYVLFSDIESNRSITDKLEGALNSPNAVRNRMKEVLALKPEEVLSVSLNYTDNGYANRTEYIRQDELRRFLEDCVQADILDGNLGRVSLVYDSKNENSTGNCAITIFLPSKEEKIDYPGGEYAEAAPNKYLSNSRTITIYPNAVSKKTLAFLKEMGINPIFGNNPKYYSPVIHSSM